MHQANYKISKNTTIYIQSDTNTGNDWQKIQKKEEEEKNKKQSTIMWMGIAKALLLVEAIPEIIMI